MKNLVASIAKKLRQHAGTLAVAESCTGGLLASALTDFAGASAFFRGGVVAYSAEMKIALLGVSAGTIERAGVVSRECAEAMARGAAEKFGADFALATTGVAGPGAHEGIPAGTVCIALHTPAGTISQTYFFENESRAGVRTRAVKAALELLEKALLRDFSRNRNENF